MNPLSELEPMPVADTATSHEHNEEDNQAATLPVQVAVGAAIASPSRKGTAPVHFSIPEQDREFFHKKLGDVVQDEIVRTLKFLRAIHAGGNIEAGCRRTAATLARTDGRVVNGQLLPPRGFTAKSLQRKYYDFLKGCTRIEAGREVEYQPGDWRMFWDKAKWPIVKTGVLRRNSDSALSPAFIQFLRANHDNNQRGKFAQWYDELLHIWRTRHVLNGVRGVEFPDSKKVIKAGCKVPYIPGYSEWPDADPDTGVPFGWSLSNLQRKCERDNFERDAATIGKAAASSHRLKVHTTRVGLLPGEFFEFDDHEFNVKVVYPGQLKFLRPRGFFAIDVLSASCFARGLKPTLWDLDLQKKEALTQKDYVFFLIHILTRYGYRSDARGTMFVEEHGTSRSPDWFEQRIHDVTQGHVKISRGGKFQARAHVGQLDAANPGFGKGNYRFKALIESFFNLVDNAFASLPGQTGLNRERCPEQLAMLESECKELIVAMQSLPAERAGQIEIGLPTWEQFFWQAQQLFDFIDDRKRHNLEGWAKLGFITQPQLTPAGAIVVPARAMSPKEVFFAGRPQLTPLRLHELPALLGPEHCYRANGKDTVEVRNGVVTIDNEEWTGESDAIRFLAVDYHGDRLRNAERFRAYLNPFDTSVLVLTDADNRPLAECPRFDAAARNDLDAVKRNMAVAKQWEARALEEMNVRHVAAGTEIARRHENNADVIAGRSLRDEENEQAALERRNARRAASEPDDISAFGEPEQTRSEKKASTASDQMDALNEF
jgi:hypothetical protein